MLRLTRKPRGIWRQCFNEQKSKNYIIIFKMILLKNRQIGDSISVYS